MARRKTTKRVEVENYSHNGSSRKNIPPAKIAGEGKIPKTKEAVYSYSPHLAPEMRFDTTGDSDRLAAIVEKACAGQTLSKKEKDILQNVAKNAEQPWLEWTGKAEEHDRGGLEVDPVALHIHERISSNAIVRAALRDDVQRDLFADPEQDYRNAVQFYQHDVDWANRLILGDSLQVMSSLARREDLAGKVQMIYIDPPYGIKFASNFQSEVGKRDVKDKDADLTREPEMVKAYRDTWHLGIHSYLSYIRDRLLIARELLADSGSIFVQISDENLHRVRQMMDEVFGPENCCSIIPFVTTSSQTSELLASTNDFLIWFGKDRNQTKFRRLYKFKQVGEAGGTKYTSVELESGERGPSNSLAGEELPQHARVYRPSPMVSQSGGENSSFSVQFEGKERVPRSGFWKTNRTGINRLIMSNRIVVEGRSIAYVRYLQDFPVFPISSFWADTWGVQSRSDPKRYVVQTSTQVIERCMLMASDPGDLVLDPTCGAGTTAYVAEQWGRRWITIDTSRVSLALARQRLLTSQFERYRVREETTVREATSSSKGIDPSNNFVYMTVPHVKLSSIARNDSLDPIYATNQPILDDKLATLNQSLGDVTDALRKRLAGKLAEKMQEEGLRAATDADHRRWLLPGSTKSLLWESLNSKPSTFWIMLPRFHSTTDSSIGKCPLTLIRTGRQLWQRR